MASTPGIGTTNLDINAIVSQLMSVERRPLAALAAQQSQIQARISAWGRVKGALESLRNAIRDLDTPERFRTMKASVADGSLASASASASAAAGSYSLEVLALAQAHKLRSAAFASALQEVGTGTLTFQFGTYDSTTNTFTLNADKPAQSVIIAAGQGSLAGIRDAVNAAGIGVTASVVNDGSGERLVFASKDTGRAASLKVSVADTDGNHTDDAGLSQLAYDPTAAAGSGKNLTETAAAQDASLRLDGIAISKPSNRITDAIQGVTLDLLKASAGTTTTVTVSRDSDAVKSAVRKFVDAHNAAATVFKDLMGYNAQTKQAGQLQGDAVGISIVSRLRSAIVSGAQILSASLGSLSEVGVRFQADGTLALDEAVLAEAMEDSFDDIAAVFTRTLKASHAAVSYRGAGENTRAGTYDVAVTRAATRGTLVGSAAAGLTITAGTNDAVAFTVDGVAASVTLAAGTYASADALAAELQTKLNGVEALADAGISVTVAQSAGVLTVTSARYGSESSVAVEAGTGAANLFGGAPVATAGVDVAGTINGTAASGAGRVLTGAAGDASEGLMIEVASDSTGSFGTVTFSIGYAHQITRVLDEMLAEGGAIEARTDGLNERLKAFDRRRADLEERLARTEERYRAQFVALDAMLARMNSTASFLASQLAALPTTRT